MIKSILFLVVGTVLAKLSPVLFSWAIFSNYGSTYYSDFIAFIMTSNMLITIGVLGVVPQIISSKDAKVRGEYYLLPVVTILTSFFLLLLFGKEKVSHPNVVIIYAVASAFIYLATASLNRSLKNEESALIWVFLGLGSLLPLPVFYFYKINVDNVFVIYVFSVVCVAVWGSYFALTKIEVKAFLWSWA